MRTLLTNAELRVINRLGDKGYAIILWTPEELRGVSAIEVEDRSIEFGHQLIDDLTQQD